MFVIGHIHPKRYPPKKDFYQMLKMTKGSKVDSVARIKMHSRYWSTNFRVLLFDKKKISPEENSEKLSDFLTNITRNHTKI